MTTGINATITTLSPNTTARAEDVMASLNSLNSSGVSNDGVISTNGSGTMTLVKVAMTTGSIKRIARFSGSGNATITHSWGEQADIVLVYYNGDFGGPPTQAIAVYSETSNAFSVRAQSGYSWTACVIKF
jgi:hypothetical protein